MKEDRKANQNLPSLRFPEFEGEWVERKLGEIAQFFGGGTPESIPSYWEGTIPWISSSDISEISIHKIAKTRFITNSAIAKSATKLIPRGSILIVSRVGIGKFAVSDEELCTSQDFTNLVCKENEYFAAYYFKARTNRFTRLSQGTSIKGFTTKDIKLVKFQFPTIEEQQKIAKFFTSIDKRIQCQIETIEDVQSLIKGFSQKLFTQELRFKRDNGEDFPDWEEKKLKDICKKKSSNISANSLIDNFGDYEIYGANGVLKKINFYQEEKPYIAIVKDGAGVGRTILCKPCSSVLGTLDKISPLNGYNLYFIYLLINRIRFRKYVTGSTIPHIYFKDYSNERTNTPSIEEQTKIATFISSLDKKLKIEQEILKQYKEQKKYLLQNMFV